MIEYTAEVMRKYANGKKERDRKIEEENRIKREENIKYIIMNLIIVSAENGKKQLEVEAKQLLKDYEDESKTEFLENKDFEWIKIWLESLGYTIKIEQGMFRMAFDSYYLRNSFYIIPGDLMTISWKGE